MAGLSGRLQHSNPPHQYTTNRLYPHKTSTLYAHAKISDNTLKVHLYFAKVVPRKHSESHRHFLLIRRATINKSSIIPCHLHNWVKNVELCFTLQINEAINLGFGNRYSMCFDMLRT